MTIRMWVVAVAAAAWMAGVSPGLATAAPAPESKRLTQAKDYIADEQWSKAIAELQVVVKDTKDPNRDEAMFWLAHSEHQIGDDASAIQTIALLERTQPASRWVRPARSLRVEIAQRLRRDDLLWMIATPPPPPAPPAIPSPAAAPVAPAPPGAVAARAMTPVAAPPRPAQPAPPVPPAMARPAAAPAPAAPPPMTPPPTPRPAEAPVPPEAPVAPEAPVPDYWLPLRGGDDTGVRIEALRSLMDTHQDKVIPLLRDIALDRRQPDYARRALFVLSQSSRPEARNVVVEVARTGAGPLRLAAVRELGRFDGPNISRELMQVYSTADNTRLKREVVSSLGQRADNVSLLRIARSETDTAVRNNAILTLGRIPNTGRDLRILYVQTPEDSRPAVLTALFTAKDEDELIRIADTEKNAVLRGRARRQLAMLATPKALAYLRDHPER